MNKPEAFSSVNANSRKINIEVINEHLNKIKWDDEGSAAIDLGCGDGSFTSILREKYIPKRYTKFIACDVSENMVNFATQRYGDENTTFKVWDIQNDMPKEYFRGFNKVFSFLTLHWIRDQKKAFQNIYDLLVDGGDCLLSFVGTMPVYDVYLLLSETNKWKTYLRDLKTIPFLSTYHLVQNPEIKIEEMMTKIGYINIQVKCKERELRYRRTEEFKDLMRAVDPFNMPEEVQEEFLNDVLRMSHEMGHFHTQENNFNELNIIYYLDIIDVYASR